MAVLAAARSLNVAQHGRVQIDHSGIPDSSSLAILTRLFMTSTDAISSVVQYPDALLARLLLLGGTGSAGWRPAFLAESVV
jgi:hypothetical protein